MGHVVTSAERLLNIHKAEHNVNGLSQCIKSTLSILPSLLFKSAFPAPTADIGHNFVMQPENMPGVNMSDEETDRKAVEVACERYFAAFKTQDIAYLMSMLATDFEWKTIDGDILPAREAAALLESYVQSFEFIETARGEISDLSIHDNEATFTITEYICGTLKDEQGNLQKISTVETSLDVMTKGPQGWQFRRAETLS